MNPPLAPVAVRILGALIEKEATTPESYPLTLNALMLACNQTSNRDPVMSLNEDEVARGVDELRRRSLIRGASGIGSRTMRYRHLAGEALNVDRAQLAVLSALMLRGAQTAGEIRARTGRMYDFADLDQVVGVLDGLASREMPLVTQLPRQPGQKEERYAHLLAGDVTVALSGVNVPQGNATAGPTRIEALEQTVETLRGEVAALRAELMSFRKQFE
jgi:uncharacterized protein